MVSISPMFAVCLFSFCILLGVVCRQILCLVFTNGHSEGRIPHKSAVSIWTLAERITDKRG